MENSSSHPQGLTQPPLPNCDVTFLPASLLLLTLAASAMTGCDATDPDESAAATAPQADARDEPTAHQLQGIEALNQQAAAAWNAHDAATYAGFYTEHAEFVSPLGSNFKGREAIRSHHAFLFGPAGPWREAVLTSRVRQIVPLTGTLAIVDLDTRVTNYSFVPFGLPQYEPGAIRVLIKWVVVFRKNEWVLSQQMTAVQPGVVVR